MPHIGELQDKQAELTKTVAAGGGGGGATTLDGLTDVTLSTPTTGQVLKYNGTAWVNDTDATGGGGGGSGASVGTAVLDFGASPAAEASVTVTGQSGILSGSTVDAFIQGGTTADNGAEDHRFAVVALRLIADSVVAGTGFTIYATSISGLATGTFNVKWRWQ
jgi:hypothetical protein